MHFNHSSLLTPPRFTPSHPLSKLYVIFLFLQHIESNLCCPYTHRVVINLWESTVLKRTDHSFPGSHELPIALHPWIGAQESRFSPCWSADCPDLVQVFYRRPQRLGVYAHSGPALSGRYCFSLILPNFWLIQPFQLPFHDGTEPWGELWCRYLLCGPSISQYSMHFGHMFISATIHGSKEPSLMRFKRSPHLWIERYEFRVQFGSMFIQQNNRAGELLFHGFLTRL